LETGYLSFPEEVQILMELGLTSLQARIYLAIHKLGTANISSIASCSNVARSDVYRVTRKLQKIGLIEQEITYPLKERAIPLETAFGVLLERKNKKLTELKSRGETFLKKHKNNNFSVKNFPEESKFVMVPSKEVLMKRLESSINNCRVSIEAATSSKRFMFACSKFKKAIDRAWSRDTRGRVVIEIPRSNMEEILEFKETWKPPYADIRYVRDIPPTVMVMYDRREVFIFVDPEADLSSSPALWSNNPCLLSMVVSYFELLWVTAMETPHHNIDINHS
jgi:sugar-specific transcriptional regulator TrmB